MAKPKKVEGSLEFNQEAEIALREVAKGILNTVSELTANKIIDSTFKQKLEEVDKIANGLLKKLNQGAAIMPKDLESFTTAVLKANQILAQVDKDKVFKNKDVAQFQKVTKGGKSVFPTPTAKATDVQNKGGDMSNIAAKMESNLKSIANNALRVLENTKSVQQHKSLITKFVDACKSFVSAIKSLFSGKKNVDIVRNEKSNQTRQTMLSDSSRVKQQGVAGMGNQAVQKAQARNIKPEAPPVPPRRDKGRPGT